MKITTEYHEDGSIKDVQVDWYEEPKPLKLTLENILAGLLFAVFIYSFMWGLT